MKLNVWQSSLLSHHQHRSIAFPTCYSFWFYRSFVFSASFSWSLVQLCDQKPGDRLIITSLVTTKTTTVEMMMTANLEINDNREATICVCFCIKNSEMFLCAAFSLLRSDRERGFIRTIRRIYGATWALWRPTRRTRWGCRRCVRSVVERSFVHRSVHQERTYLRRRRSAPVRFDESKTFYFSLRRGRLAPYSAQLPFREHRAFARCSFLVHFCSNSTADENRRSAVHSSVASSLT